MARHRILLATVFAALAAAPLAAQQRVQDWQYKWFWGAHAGVMSYDLPTIGTVFTPQAGAEWLITARRVALYAAYTQSFQSEQDTFAVQGLAGTQSLSFDGMRRLQVGIVAMIGDKALQPYAGAGFTIHTLTNTRLVGATASSTVQTAINDAASGGFGMVLAGVNYRMTKKMIIYGQFLYTPQGRDFLLAGGSTNITGGVRYAFLNARADDSGRR